MSILRNDVSGDKSQHERTKTFSFRFANAADRDAIYALIYDLENETLDYEIFSQIYAKQLADDRYRCIVAEIYENLIAVLNFRFEWQLHHTEKIAEIIEFIVHKDFRNQRLGKELLEKGITIAKSEGCSQVEVCCNQKREAAHRFYLKEGFCNTHYKFCFRKK